MMNKTFILLALAFFVSFDVWSIGPSTIPDEKAWKKEKEIEGYSIYSRNEEGSSILGFKLAGKIDAPIEQVMQHLRDVERSSEWTPGLVTKQTIEDKSDLEAITYSVSEMPWPLKSRDYIMHNELFLHKEKKLLYVISYSIDDPRKGLDDKYVRADIGYSNIGVRPVSDNETYIEWTVFADPKGVVPAFVVNFYQKKYGIEFFKALEKRCREKKLSLRPGLVKMLIQLRKILQ